MISLTSNQPSQIPMMSRRHRTIALLTVLTVFAAGWLLPTILVAAEAGSFTGSFRVALDRIRKSDLYQHVNVLASDTFEGREAGTRGGKAAGTYLIEQLKKYGVLPGGPEHSFYQYFGNDYRNILAVLPGSDRQLKDEYIVVGAHYDHVGFGNRTNSLGPVGFIHNGADDNASGTAGLLEVIEAFSSLHPRPKRSILFAFWDAEEKGLLGSQHWVKHPTVPLAKVRMNFNVDMIGRLRNQTVEVFGVRTSIGLRRFLSEQNRVGSLLLDFNWDHDRNSDHFPFFERRIPFVMFHTRKHDDYHRPSDDIEKLNMDGIETLARLMFRSVHAAAQRETLPSFRRASMSESEHDRLYQTKLAASGPARLGAAWNANLAKDAVIELTRVSQGSPAQRAGLEVGDRILNFGGYEIDNRHDFRTIVLASENPVSVTVQRKGHKTPLKVTLEINGRPRRLGIEWRFDPAEPGCAVLTRIVPGSVCFHAGLRRGDRVYTVDGKSFQTSHDFFQLVTVRKQYSLALTVESHGGVRTVQIELLPPPEPRPIAAEKPTG